MLALLQQIQKNYLWLLKLSKTMALKKYFNDYIGFNNRMDEDRAAFLIEKLKKLRKINSNKIKIAKTYDKYLNSKFIKPKIDNFHNVFHIYPIRVNKRNKFIKYLKKQKIPFNIHYPIAPHKQKALRKIFGKKFYQLLKRYIKLLLVYQLPHIFQKKKN